MVVDGFVDLFDGTSLAGWRAVPRVYGTVSPGGVSVADLLREQGMEPPEEPERHPARWTVEDGVVVGRQDPPGCGYGGYLVTERAFGDFELVLEAKPDWPADTGVMVRRRRDTWEGFQVLLDHRPHGGIGGFFGNGLASFSAVPFTVDAEQDEEGTAIALRTDDPGIGPHTRIGHRRAQLAVACDATEFLQAWSWGDWNELRVRCIGHLPRLTTWVNGLLVAELDTAAIDWPGFDPEVVARTLGPTGHIALEVHDNDPVSGTDRWGPEAACRWRNIRIAEL